MYMILGVFSRDFLKEKLDVLESNTEKKMLWEDK